MKSMLLGIVALTVVSLASCGSSANTETKQDSTIATTASGAVADSKSLSVENKQTAENGKPDEGAGKVIHLDKQMFIDKVFDFEKNAGKWNYVGEKPCIIDFYADWCRPCKMVAPIMDELAKKYKGQIIVYKVNTDEQKEIARAFGIRSIPTVFFCPMKGEPQLTQGALPKEQFEEIVNKVLLSK